MAKHCGIESLALVSGLERFVGSRPGSGKVPGPRPWVDLIASDGNTRSTQHDLEL